MSGCVAWRRSGDCEVTAPISGGSHFSLSCNLNIEFQRPITMANHDVQPVPSAPSMYPQLGSDPQVFRLQRVNEVTNQLRAAIERSENTAGKYKKAVVGLRNTTMLAGCLGAVLGASATAFSLTGIGIVAGIPLASLAALLRVTSVTTAAIQARLSRKLEKHQLTLAPGRSKLDGISKIFSAALVDNTISDDEYRMVLEALDRYRDMKAVLREKGRGPAPAGEGSLRRKIMKEVREQIRKKLELGDETSDMKEV